MASTLLTVGALVLVGGALSDDNAPVYRAILDHRLPGKPLCVIPLASEDAAAAARESVAVFDRHGGPGTARAIDLPGSAPERARDPAIAADLRGCGGFFFTGGDQARIVDALRPGGVPTPADDAIRAVRAAGGVISGSSAGLAMMSDPMIGAGEPADALRRGITGSEAEGGVWVRNGMGFMPPGVLVDQHSLVRGRPGRVFAVLAEKPFDLVYMVDEDTALLWDGERAEVLGSSNVLVLDARRRGEPWRLFLLGAGDAFRPGARRPVTPAAGKKRLARGGAAPAVPSDPWKGPAFASFLGELVQKGNADVSLPAGRYTLELRTTRATKARAREGQGPLKLPLGLCAGPVDAVLRPNPN